MYARMIQLQAKPGKGNELLQTMLDRPLTNLKNQPGFVDGFALIPESDSDQFVGLSIWKSKADAEKFIQTSGPQQLESYKHLIQGEPTFRSFDLASSTIHNVAAKRAATG